MIVETELKLKLTADERKTLVDCQELLIKIARQTDELDGEFDEVSDRSIDEALNTLMTLSDISEEYFGV